MNRIERVERVLNGKEPDRPPLSLWYHFGVQHGGGARFARLALEYFHHYDFDFLKVMNDYFYPRPGGLDAVRTRADLDRIGRFDPEASGWAEQFRALEIIGRELRGKAFFVDTVFDPWQSIKRSMAGENMKALMEREPLALLAALDVVTENLIAYSLKSLEIGSAGIFLSVAAGGEIVSREDFLRFVKPFSLRLLSAVRGRGTMNIAHIHGEDLFFDDCLDLPADALNWWDRGPQGPTLQWVKERIDGCVMGGIDHKLVARTTRAFLRNHVRQGRELGGRTRFFLAGGCSIDTWVSPEAVKAIVEAAREE